MNVLLAVVTVLSMLVCLLLIPLGLPGLWLIAVLTLGLALAGKLAWGTALSVAAVTAVAEIAELLLLRRFGAAFGGSSRAFWGAVLGGMVGLVVGAPVPVIGSIVTAFVGSFLGAGAVTFAETRSFRESARVGWGVVLARSAAVGLKVAVAVVVIAVVGVAVL